MILREESHYEVSSLVKWISQFWSIFKEIQTRKKSSYWKIFPTLANSWFFLGQVLIFIIFSDELKLKIDLPCSFIYYFESIKRKLFSVYLNFDQLPRTIIFQFAKGKTHSFHFFNFWRSWQPNFLFHFQNLFDEKRRIKQRNFYL